MKLPYREGTLFGLPLRNGGYGVGLVARTTAKGKVILCYFYGPPRNVVPVLSQMERLKPAEATRIARVGDLGLIRGEWPIIGLAQWWTRAEWPMPRFVRRDPLSGRAWRVFRSELDPGLVEREEPEPYESILGTDSLSGWKAAEIHLSKLLYQQAVQ